MSAISSVLKEYRGRQNQSEFAAKFGLKVAVYSHYETGKREPSLDTVILIAKVLNITTDRLLGVNNESPNSINATGNAIVATGGSRVVAKKTTQVTPDCAKCPYKIAIENLKKSGFSFKGL